MKKKSPEDLNISQSQQSWRRSLSKSSTRWIWALSAPILFLGLAVALHSLAQQHAHRHSDHHQPHELCHGFIPENDLYIPVDDYRNLNMDEETYHAVLDRIEEVYTPIIAQRRARLVVNRQWSNGRVNASASRDGNRYIITMFGGLARHEQVTPDGLMLVACHEIGHHIGGSPKYSGWTTWASNEGQSDYFANLHCMRLVYTHEENEEWLAHNEVDPFVVSECKRVWGDSLKEQNICMRSSMAGFSVSRLFQEIRNEEEEPRFDQPDPTQVDSTFASHPGTQCRLDTYFQAALCERGPDDSLDDRDYRRGTCTETSGHEVGLRPRCWFRPGRDNRRNPWPFPDDLISGEGLAPGQV